MKERIITSIGIGIVGIPVLVLSRYIVYPIFLGLLSAKKIGILPMVSRVVKPEDASKVYTELCENKEFPMGTVFDWREM